MKIKALHKGAALYYHLLCPIIIFYAMEWLLRNPFHEKWGIKAVLVLVNLVFFYAVTLFFYALSGSLRLSLYVVSVSSFLFGLTDYYVYRFRGNTIVPWDFLSLRTAASVADNYDYTPEKRVVIASIVFVLLWISIFFCRFKIKEDKKLRTALSAGSLVFILFAYIPFVQSEQTIKNLKVYNKLFTPSTMTMRDGTAFAFIYDMKFLSVDKPEDYDKDAIRSALYKEYGGDDNERTTADPSTPNIIVIMCEAFSDPGVVTEFNTNEDFMPFIRSLMEDENVISGRLHVSVKGGNTPNTEFEYLTGNSMAFLPQGSIPFQQFVKGPTDAMPSYLEKRGYRSVGMHPYKPKGWARNEAYPFLGFKETCFIDYFEKKDPVYIRKYVSDESLFNEIIDMYKENGTNTPLFSFNVTMQNHSEYSGEFDNFTPDIEVEGLDGTKPIENYLSLEKLTDSAFRDFISYFDSINDPTVVVFFGDHQSADHVMEALLKQNGKTGSDLTEEENRLRYVVPFLIWANYDIEEKKDLDVSASFLGNLTLEAAGIDITGYRSFLKEQYDKTPVVSAIHVMKADGTDADTDINDPDLMKYRQYQYYELFDDDDTLD
ncbi:MAG: LTA synthase family protein [Lachnospiraceae bacterium]|nr:LTA synthase family protein [Lachnospiraceae bacterium]